jgi:hypothetical protein
MNKSNMVDATFFYFFDRPKPVSILTRAKPEDLHSLAEATQRLQERRQALVARGDAAALAAVLAGEEVRDSIAG